MLVFFFFSEGCGINRSPPCCFFFLGTFLIIWNDTGWNGLVGGLAGAGWVSVWSILSWLRGFFNFFFAVGHRISYTEA